MTGPIDNVIPTSEAPPASAERAALAGAIANSSTGPPATADDAPPPRAAWSSRAPDATWCPPEWRERLQALGLDCDPPVDAVGATLSAGRWSVLAASRRGRQHAHRGEHREDAIAVRRTTNGWCGAVADGAGSAPWSRVGASVATEAFTAAFAAYSGPLRARATASAHSAYTALRDLAEAFDVPTRAMRTTLLVVAVDGDEIATLQVGDGGIALLSADGQAIVPQVGDAGEFSGEVSHFLPDNGSLERLIASLLITPVANTRAVLVASDGIEDPWYPLTRHAPLLAESLASGVDDTRAARIQAANGVQFVWRGPVCLADDASGALADWMTFEKRGENDDRSLLFARLTGPR